MPLRGELDATWGLVCRTTSWQEKNPCTRAMRETPFKKSTLSPDCLFKAEDRMAAKEGENEEFVYRISTAKEWEVLQKEGFASGGDLDKSAVCFHLSKLNQVESTLQNFFLNITEDLYLLQIDAKKLGDGLVYEVVDGVNRFPHFYGPNRSFSPLPLESVVKAERLSFSDGRFSCSFLNQ